MIRMFMDEYFQYYFLVKGEKKVFTSSCLRMCDLFALEQRQSGCPGGERNVKLDLKSNLA